LGKYGRRTDKGVRWVESVESKLADKMEADKKAMDKEAVDTKMVDCMV